MSPEEQRNPESQSRADMNCFWCGHSPIVSTERCRVFECPKCHEMTYVKPTRAQLKELAAILTRASGVWTCPHCGNSMSRPMHIAYHMRTCPKAPNLEAKVGEGESLP